MLKEEAKIKEEKASETSSNIKTQFCNEYKNVTNKCGVKAAHDIVHATADKLDVNIVVFQEPNKKLKSDLTWVYDTKIDVAVWYRTNSLGLIANKCEIEYIKL